MRTKRKTRKGGSFLPEGVDPQLVEVTLSKEEERCLMLRTVKPPSSYQDIAKHVFHGKKTRQAVQLIVRRAKEKKWRMESYHRHVRNLGACPIDEVPLPSRTRKALGDALLTRMNELAGLSEHTLSEIAGVGSYGAHLIVKLLKEWGLRGTKAKSFCPKCGASLTSKIDAKGRRIKCHACNTTCEVEVIEKSEAA